MGKRKRLCIRCLTRWRCDWHLCRRCARETGYFIPVPHVLPKPREPEPPRGPLYQVVVEGEVFDVMWNGSR